MSHFASLPLWVLLTPVITALLILLLQEQQRRLRTTLNLAGATINVGLVAIMLFGVFQENTYELRWPLLPGFDLTLRADAFALFFAALSAGLWLLTTVYATGYFAHSQQQRRFFTFFSLCVAATMGVAMAGNLLTFFIFYELLTLATYPLVVHSGSPAALAAGATYLRYTLSGGAILLLAIVCLYALAGAQEFTVGGSLGHVDADQSLYLQLIFALFMIGFGVKAALFPLHGWLPSAMVAPAPVSALLHAVAVVKAGAFGIVRTVYDVYGAELTHQLLVSDVLAVVAAFTIIYGSVRALSQDDLKKRLAYSTISQVSYIALGVAIAGPLATLGGIVHLVHQGLMKITLFFCAGNLAETLKVHRVSEMDGVGQRMPWTMTAFTIGALGMVGLPPMAGFISKWYLGLGSLAADQAWVILVLLASTLLNAAYFLPVLYRVWFKSGATQAPRHEARWSMVAPPVITAGLALLAGLLAGAPFSPLQWAALITEREYP